MYVCIKINTMKMTPDKLKTYIEKNRKGRTQTYIISEMNKRGCELTDVQFSRKKHGHDKFTEEELKILKEILDAA